MSLWKKLFGRKDPVATPPAPVPPPPRAVLAVDDAWLVGLIGAVVDGKRTDEIATRPFWEAIERLEADGHSRLAAEWLEKFAIATPAGDAREAILERAAMLRFERGEDAEGVPHLEALTASPARAANAHFLLGEHHRREGDLRRALRHFEAVLARDVEYPNARVRVDALRARLGAAAPPPAALDETIAGPDGRAGAGARYRLLRELGRGATGAVYLSRDAELERDVAVKLLHPHLAAASRKGDVARFFDEARVTAALRHPNIVAILDLDEKYRRIVMELCAGGTLQARLKRGPLPLAAALERHLEILSALAAAHRRGVVHRDLKPANLLYRRDPDAPGSEVVLVDFGVAHLTGTQEAVGTLLYMAPEQRRAEAVPESDVYAAGLILRECLTGVRPALSVAPPPLPAGTPPEVAAHIDRLVATQPTARPSAEKALAAARTLRDQLRTGSAALARDWDEIFPS